MFQSVRSVESAAFCAEVTPGGSAPAGRGATFDYAKVCRAVEQGVEVEVEAQILAARIGFGCLVQPIPGDRVLLWRGPEGAFVVSVLERLAPDRATLALPSGGALAIEADDISIIAGKAVSIDAREINLRGQKFHLVADSVTMFGRLAHWVAENLRISARTLDTVADTLSSRALDRVAIVERADILRAATVSQTIDNVAVTNAPAVVIATSEDLRLDGKRVTVG